MKKFKLASLVFALVGCASLVFATVRHSSAQAQATAAEVVVAPTSPWIYGPAGGVTQLPAGDITLTDTLVIENQFGPVVQGAGRFLTRIIWKGPAGKPVIAFRSCNHPILQDLTVHCFTPCRSVVCLSTSSAPTVTNTAALIQRCWFECSNNATDCIEINNNADGGSDNNGEQHRISDCQINDFKRNGVGIYSTQSHKCEITHCQIKTANKPGTTGVYARYGSQTIDHCNGGGLDLVVYASDQFAGSCQIINNNFENCKRFVDCRLPSGQWIITNNRCDGMLPYPLKDNVMDEAAVFCHANGFTRFENNFFASNNGNQIQIMFGGNVGLDFIGNRFNGQPKVNVAWSDPINNKEWTWRGNTWQNSAGVNTAISRP